MLDKKQTQVIFFQVSSKCVIKQWRQLATSTTHLAQELLPNVQCSGGWFKKFCKGDECLEDEECRGRPLKGANDQLRAFIEADPLTTTQEVAKEISVDHSVGIGHSKQVRKVKKLTKWVPQELTKNNKIVVLRCRLLLLYAAATKYFSIRLWCVMTSGFYVTAGDNQLSSWTKKKL